MALQWVVLSFMPNFTAVMRELVEEDESVLGTSSSSPRTVRTSRGGGGGTMPRVGSADKLARQVHGQRKSLATPPGHHMSSSTTELDRVTESLPRRSRKSFIAPPSSHSTASLSSLASMAAYGPELTKKFKPFYPRVMGGLMVLERDPDPQTADMAKSVLDGVWSRVAHMEQDRMNTSAAFRSFSRTDAHSVSAPSSPQARASFLLGGSSPPPAHNTTLPAAMSSSQHSSSLLNHTGGDSKAGLQRSGLGLGATIAEDGGEGGLKTQFIDWSSRYFSCRLMRLPGSEDHDGESGESWQRDWWANSNEVIEARAAAERDSLEEGTGRLDEQLGVAKLCQSPSVLAYQPSSCSLAVATRDTVVVLERQDKSPPQVWTSWPNGNPRLSQVTSLQFANSQDRGLLIAGADDGSVRLWRGWQARYTLHAAC